MAHIQQGQLAHINATKLYFEIRGQGDPLLLLHGFTGSGADWRYAGGEQLEQNFQLIVPDARGHGRSDNPERAVTHKQYAADVLELLNHLGIERCKAIGMSFGANTLLHVAIRQPERIKAMVLVSGALYFPEQARRLMRETLVDEQPPGEWQAMRERHRLGDEQIRDLWRQQRGFADSYDDVAFTPPHLSQITARTLIVYGDRDPLYPVEMAVQMYRAIERCALWVVPEAGHGPIFLEAADLFARTATAFLSG